ncbi:hypothetical protein [Lederbergia citrea]|uniref:Uncharacterized protein n=1 Tax=Lederbergia citrea TaxID=2833581 RepID=A0A942Z539_9BACI|nr:hypothetical protein [Lederbergia citrea]MBS4176291.1 hypothetical protein [Lederbergia citrea]MBS4222481.1 hypothetical protein [Lederbergia citrea]
MEQFLLFIIIAIVSLIFNRKKVANHQEQRRHQGRPTAQPVQPVQMENEQRKDLNRPIPQHDFPDLSKARNLKEAAEILVAKTQPTIIEKKAEVLTKMEDLKKEEETLRKKAVDIKTMITNTPKEHIVTELQFEGNDILKGIVMSEVLGPPRAKKPYRRI